MNRRKNKLTEYFDDNPDTRRIFFLVFYIIFFIFIAIILRQSSSVSTTTYTKKNTGLNKSYTLDDISSNNYHLNIVEDINGVKNVYDGDINKDKALFDKSGNPSLNYYKEGNSYYLRNNNTLQYDKTDNPFASYKFITKDGLNNLIIHGTYLSITNYFSGEEKDYNYLISTSTISRLFDNKEVDVDDKENTLTIKSNNEHIIEIDMDLTSYYHMLDKNITNYKLTLTYSKYGEVGDININKNY